MSDNIAPRAALTIIDQNINSDVSVFRALTPEQLDNTASRREGTSAVDELLSRQKTAEALLAMGQQLNVSLKYINFAVVYMHRFYMCHSFKRYHRIGIASACLYVAAKREQTEEEADSIALCSVEDILKAQFAMLNGPFPGVDSRPYKRHADDLIANEKLLRETKHFNMGINLPHPRINIMLEMMTETEARNDLSKAALFLASNCLHLTTMCLEYDARTIACFCMYLACKWTGWQASEEDIENEEVLKQMTKQYLAIYAACPAQLKLELQKELDWQQRQNQSISVYFPDVSDIFAQPKKWT